jgi:hypothetical protein
VGVREDPHSSDRRTWTWPRSSRGPSGARSRGVYRADEHVTLWKGCRKQGGRLVQGREEVFANVSAGADKSWFHKTS